MRPFMHDDFLLSNPSAVELYHRYAESMPIIDYHCHLPPADLAGDRRWENLTQVWLAGDHYKWRALRAHGVAERFITGDTTDWEKFEQWAALAPHTVRNPLHHWTHLELKKPFGITDRLLGPTTAQSVWAAGIAKLAEPGMSCRGIVRQWDVQVICTTDDPVDDLRHHRALAQEGELGFRVLPAFRPDRALFVEQGHAFNAWLDLLGAAAGLEVRTWDHLLAALSQRADYFHAAGCRLSDCGIERVCAEDTTPDEAARIFARARGGQPVAPAEGDRYRSVLLVELGRLYHARGWVQQLHLGALRNNNTRLAGQLGQDCGVDSIGDFEQARPLSRLLDRLDREDRLAKTILYNLNPADNEVFAAMIGNFQDGRRPGKLQYGSAWWFLDQKDGMERQLNALSNLGLLSRFVGMLTDSRSFLSYSRHEYFRRILCNLLGAEVEEGLLPNDLPFLGSLVQDLSYRNAAAYFPFGQSGNTASS